MYQLLLSDALQDATFQAAQADLRVSTDAWKVLEGAGRCLELRVSTDVGWDGFSLSLGGFDQHLAELSALVAATLRTVPLEPTAFERRRDDLQREIANLEQRPPTQLAAYHRSRALESPRWSNAELLAAAKALTLADVERFQSRLLREAQVEARACTCPCPCPCPCTCNMHMPMLREAQVEAFLYGNLRAEEAVDVVVQLCRALPMRPLPTSRAPVRRVRRLPRGSSLQQFVASSPSETNSAVEVYYQVGTDEGMHMPMPMPMHMPM